MAVSLELQRDHIIRIRFAVLGTRTRTVVVMSQQVRADAELRLARD